MENGSTRPALLYDFYMLCRRCMVLTVRTPNKWFHFSEIYEFPPPFQHSKYPLSIILPKLASFLFKSPLNPPKHRKSPLNTGSMVSLQTAKIFLRTQEDSCWTDRCKNYTANRIADSSLILNFCLIFCAEGGGG